MLSINIMEDEELQGVIKRFISSLLPHEKFSDTLYSTNLGTIYKYVKLEELSMEYYVVLKILSDLNKIKSSVRSYVPTLTRSVLESTLEMSIGEVILEPRLGVKAWLSYENLNSNLEIETVRQDACQKV